ncbi:MAG: AAA domain-containing protein [Sedimenticola sp.]
MKGSKILVCCPENTAADLIISKLISTTQSGTVQKRDVFRVYASSRGPEAIPSDILVCTIFT